MKTSHTAEITPYLTEVLHTHNATADGCYEVTIYPILPGVLLAFNNVHTTTVPTAASHFLTTALSSTPAWMAGASSASPMTTTAM